MKRLARAFNRLAIYLSDVVSDGLASVAIGLDKLWYG